MLPNYSCTSPISLLLIHEHTVKKKKHSDCWQMNTDLHWTQQNGKQSPNDLYGKQSNGHIWQNFPFFFSEIMKTSSLSWINMFLKIWIKTATNLMALSGKTTNSLPPIHLVYSVYSNITNSNGGALLLLLVLNPQLHSSLWPWKYFEQLHVTLLHESTSLFSNIFFQMAKFLMRLQHQWPCQ